MADIALDPFVKRIKEDIHAPSFIILPYLYDILRDFTERSWIIYKTFEVQCVIDVAEDNNAVVIPIIDTIPNTIPIKIDVLKGNKIPYNPVMKDVVGPVDLDLLDDSGMKFYHFFNPVVDGPDTSVRIFPWFSDPLITMSIPFRTVDIPVTVPGVLLEYKEVVCSGVIARMMLQVGKAWTNPNMGMAREGIYQTGVSKVKYRWVGNNTKNVTAGKRGFI